MGGDDLCSMRSITISYSGNTGGSVPKTVTVDASDPGLATEGVMLKLQANGYNSIYAIGTSVPDMDIVFDGATAFDQKKTF